MQAHVTRTRRIGVAIVALAAAVAASACLTKETTHTVLIARDGTITWTVLEDIIGSDAKAASDRTREEADYLAAAWRGDHSPAVALWHLGALDVRTGVLGATAPFVVRTEGRFGRLDEVMNRFAAAAGARSVSTLVRRDGIATWTWTLEEDSDALDRDDTVDALSDVLDGGRFLLERGRFVSASGFTLSTCRIAVLKIPEDQPQVRLELSWSEDDDSPCLSQSK